MENSRSLPAAPFAARHIAVLDLGSNSLRLLVARVGGAGDVRILEQAREVVRLGEGAFESRLLQPVPMRRTIDALRGFGAICRRCQVDEVVAIATAAVREAANGQRFLDDVRRETGFDFTVIPGREEARLICLGIASGLGQAQGRRLFMDIGGGSTELAVVEGGDILELESLKLGAVRLADMFPSVGGAVGEAQYQAMQAHVRDQAVLPLRRLAASRAVELAGSSGTIRALARIAAATCPEGAGDSLGLLTREGLLRAVRTMCRCSEEDRRSVPGMDPRLAGILVPGAAILQTVMEELGMDRMRVSERDLRHGALENWLVRMFPGEGGSSVREDSVFRLARLCRFEEAHARHVASLALMLFDSAAQCGLCAADPAPRELLYHAAILHDIGIFVSFSGHDEHGAYLVRSSELLGFTRRETAMLAALVLFHRGGFSPEHPACAAFDAPHVSRIGLLSLFLSLAEALDKSHASAVSSALFRREGEGVCLEVRAGAPSGVERERMKRGLPAMEALFGPVRICWEEGGMPC